jgi:cobalamin biosynthesis Co2+ chelatase CbiK
MENNMMNSNLLHETIRDLETTVMKLKKLEDEIFSNFPDEDIIKKLEGMKAIDIITKIAIEELRSEGYTNTSIMFKAMVQLKVSIIGKKFLGEIEQRG